MFQIYIINCQYLLEKYCVTMADNYLFLPRCTGALQRSGGVVRLALRYRADCDFRALGSRRCGAGGCCDKWGGGVCYVKCGGGVCYTEKTMFPFPFTLNGVWSW